MLAAALDANRPSNQVMKPRPRRLKQLGKDGEDLEEEDEEEDHDHDNDGGLVKTERQYDVSELKALNERTREAVDSVLNSMRTFEVSLPESVPEHQGGRVAAEILLQELEGYIAKIKNSFFQPK